MRESIRDGKIVVVGGPPFSTWKKFSQTTLLFISPTLSTHLQDIVEKGEALSSWKAVLPTNYIHFRKSVADEIWKVLQNETLKIMFGVQ